MDVATISIFAVIIGCAIALAEWIRTIKNDFGTMAAQIRTLETRLDRFREDLDELERDEKFIEATVHKAIEERIIDEKMIAILQDSLEI